MPVVPIAVGAGVRADQQARCGQGKEEKALHRLRGTPLRVWELSLLVPACGLPLTVGAVGPGCQGVRAGSPWLLSGSNSFSRALLRVSSHPTTNCG